MAGNERKKGTWLFVLPWDIHHAGGVNQVVANLIRQARHSRIHSSDLMVVDYSFPVLTRIRGARPHTVRCRLPDPALLGSSPKGWIAFLAALAASLATIPCFFKHRNVRVVNIHYLTPTSWIFALLRRLGIPQHRLVVSLHGTDLGNVEGRTVQERMSRMALAAADLIVTPSNALRARLLEKSPQLADKTHVIHNGIDPRRISRMSSDHGAARLQSGGRRSIVTLGTFSRVKGHDLLLDAFSRIAATHPDVDLIIAGKDGPALVQSRQQVAELGLESRVRLVVDAPHGLAMQLLARASVFALPSRQESFGIAILEAGFLRIPVVAARVGGIPEIVSNAVTGRLFEPEDSDALADALAELLDDPATCQRYSSALHERVVSEFLWENAHDRYLHLVEAS